MDADQATPSLLQRIETLEASNRRLADGVRRAERRLTVGAFIALLLVSSVAMLGWAEATDVLKARVFVLQNEWGTLKEFDNGMPVVWIANPRVPANNAQITAFPSGETSILFWNDMSKSPRLAAGITGDGNPYIFMRDADGNIIWSAP